jgi:thioredoxin reductase
MLRGRLIVEELIAENIINQDKPLLVVGGGAGGVTAAMFAAQNSIPTTLVEREWEPFSVQRHSSRFIHPTQYDWPVDHYIEGSAFWNGLPMPLPFGPNNCRVIVSNWYKIVSQFANNNQNVFRLMLNTTIINIRVVGDINDGDILLQVTSNKAEVYNFSAVIWATGAGSEDCQFRNHDGIPVYEGIKFWGNDQFESERCGLTDTPQIVISGSGDGALQDFLRCVTRRNLALDIYDELFNPISSDTMRERIRKSVETKIQSAEDRARRCLIWASGREEEDSIYQELEDWHRKTINEELLNNNSIRENLGILLGKWIDEKAKISLVFRRNYFTNYYSLNRFLVLLIAQYLQNKHNHTALYRNREIRSIKPEDKGHQCMRRNSQGTWIPTKEKMVLAPVMEKTTKLP